MWLKGFFENGKPQSMTDGLALLICLGGLIYLYSHGDPAGSSVIIGLGIGLKGHKNYEARKRKEEG